MRAGKIRYFGVSNYSGWHLMKMLALADRYGWPRPVTHQVYYSLVARDFEWELMPLALDQNVGTLVWSPLSGAKLGGKIGRNKQPPEDSRAATDASWDVPEERLFAVTDVLEAIVGRDRPFGPAARACLAAHAPERVEHRDRRAQRRAAPGQSRRQRRSSFRPNRSPVSTRRARRSRSIPIGTSAGPSSTGTRRRSDLRYGAAIFDDIGGKQSDAMVALEGHSRPAPHRPSFWRPALRAFFCV